MRETEQVSFIVSASGHSVVLAGSRDAPIHTLPLVAPENPVRANATAVATNRVAAGPMLSIIPSIPSSHTITRATPTRTPLSTTSPERTESRRVDPTDGQFRPLDRARHTNRPVTRESVPPHRTRNSPQNLRQYATPAAIATGVSVNHSRHLSSYQAFLAPLMCQCSRVGPAVAQPGPSPDPD